MSDEHQEVTEEGKKEAPTKKKPAAWDPEDARQRIYKKADDLKKDPYEDNLARFFGKGTEDSEIKDIEWQSRSESEEMVDAVKRFFRKEGLTEKSSLWKKINDYKFYCRHSDILAAHEAENYDEMLRIAKNRAEREMELENRSKTIRAMQRDRSPDRRESFEDYQKRMARGGR